MLDLIFNPNWKSYNLPSCQGSIWGLNYLLVRLKNVVSEDLSDSKQTQDYSGKWEMFLWHAQVRKTVKRQAAERLAGCSHVTHFAGNNEPPGQNCKSEARTNPTPTFLSCLLVWNDHSLKNERYPNALGNQTTQSNRFIDLFITQRRWVQNVKPNVPSL